MTELFLRGAQHTQCLRKRRHHEEDDGQEAEVNAGHVPRVLRALPESFPNPNGPVGTKGSEVSLSGPPEGNPREDSVCPHRLLEQEKGDKLKMKVLILRLLWTSDTN